MIQFGGVLDLRVFRNTLGTTTDTKSSRLPKLREAPFVRFNTRSLRENFGLPSVFDSTSRNLQARVVEDVAITVLLDSPCCLLLGGRTRPKRPEGRKGSKESNATLSK